MNSGLYQNPACVTFTDGKMQCGAKTADTALHYFLVSNG